jgi:hypothetical protein
LKNVPKTKGRKRMATRIGIGTTDPQFTLDVGGDINVSGGLFSNGQDVSGALYWSETEAENIVTGANVGIGVTGEPSDKLHVAGSLNLSTGSSFKINGTDVLTGSGLGTGVTGSSLTSVGTLSSLLVSGNVGVGTATATEKLQVSGNIKVTGGEFVQEGVSIGFGSSTVSDITGNSLDPNRLYNFVTYREEIGDIRAGEWATRIDGTSGDEGRSIATDATGNVYVTGHYTGTVTIFNAGGTTFGTLANSGSAAAFVVKYNTSGTAQWATRIDGTGNDQGRSIATDATGNVYVTGFYASSPVTIFNAGGTSFGTLANSGSNAAFVVKYNTSGTAQWATRIDGTGNDGGQGIATDADGNVYVTGFYTGTVTILNADETSFGTLDNSGSLAAFVVKYNTSGAAQWATRIDGTSADEGYGIATDATGNVYVSGRYDSIPVTVFNANGTTFGTLANSGSGAAFVVKYNTSGTAQWATRIDGTGNDQGWGIATDATGNVYVTGYYTGTVTIFNADETTFGTLANSGSNAAFVVKYNTSGTTQWATRIDGTGGDQGQSIATDATGNVYVTGYYTGTVTIFNPDETTFGTLANSGSRAAFVVKFNDTGFLEIPYELPLLDNTPLNQGRAITVVNKSPTPPTIKVLNTPLENVPVSLSQKFLYYDNRWYAI